MLLLAQLALADPRHDCFASHLREAITLNETRRPLYSFASEGASDQLSAELLAIEHAALPLAESLDERARTWQNAGIGVMCDEFVSMDLAAPFTLGQSPPEPGQKLRAYRLLRTLLHDFHAGGYPGLAAGVQPVVASLSPGRACMTRHILESVLRAANLAPRHAAAAIEAGLPSPESLSKEFVLTQLYGLGEAARLDRLAEPMHDQGIPILCNDVPPISPD